MTIPDPTLTTFRDTIRRIVPPWLTGFYGYRLLYSIAIHLDALGDSVTYGVKSRFPNLYSGESLPILGRERGIIRGFDETDEQYAGRMIGWWDDHRRECNPYTLLRQIRGYLAGHNARVRIVNNAGAWYTIQPTGEYEYFKGTNWDWDGKPEADVWSRFWVIIYVPVLWVSDGNWGVGTWGDEGMGGTGGTWGTTATQEQVETIHALVYAWRAPHSYCQNVIIALDPAVFDPANTSPPLPDGTWGKWGKNDAGNYTQARDTAGRYWGGI